MTDETRDRLAKIEASYTKHLAALTTAVEITGNRIRRVVWGLIAVALIACAFGYYFITRNAEAIRVSCTLITNAVLESGAGGTQAQASSEAGRLALERQMILVSAIKLTPAAQVRLATLNARIDKLGGVVTVPDCERITRDPGSVEALSLRAKATTVTTPTITAPQP